MSEILRALLKLNASYPAGVKLWGITTSKVGEIVLRVKEAGIDSYVMSGTESDVLAHILSMLPKEERVSEEKEPEPTILPEMTAAEVAECKAAKERGATIQYRVRDQSRGATEWKDCLGEPWWAIYHSIYRPKPGTNPGEQPTQHETEAAPQPSATAWRQWLLNFIDGRFYDTRESLGISGHWTPVIEAAPALARIAELEKQVETCEMERLVHVKRCMELNQMAGDDKTRIACRDEKIKALEQQVANLQLSKTLLSKERDWKASRVMELGRQLAESRDGRDKIHSEWRSLCSENKQLHTALVASQQLVADLQQQLTAARTENTFLKSSTQEFVDACERTAFHETSDAEPGEPEYIVRQAIERAKREVPAAIQQLVEVTRDDLVEALGAVTPDIGHAGVLKWFHVGGKIAWMLKVFAENDPSLPNLGRGTGVQTGTDIHTAASEIMAAMKPKAVTREEAIADLKAGKTELAMRWFKQEGE